MRHVRVLAPGPSKNPMAAAALLLLMAACTPTSGTAEGTVIGVEGSLVEIAAFTLLSGGTELEFIPIESQSYEFPLSHLREHLRTGEPVVVEWELRDDLRYALSITDG